MHSEHKATQGIMGRFLSAALLHTNIAYDILHSTEYIDSKQL